MRQATGVGRVLTGAVFALMVSVAGADHESSGPWLYVPEPGEMFLEEIQEGEESVVHVLRSYEVDSSFMDSFMDFGPIMVVVPSGSFLMGSPEGEEDRDDDEGPVHRVTIARPFAVGVHEVMRGQFAHFVEATGHSTAPRCGAADDPKADDHDWRNPGFSQTDKHPVVCVRWEDAQAYVKWRSKETGRKYRLLSESEWEYVARAGTTGPYHFRSGLAPSLANYAESGHEKTVPAGSYPANGFGLHDVHGNVREWVEDCYNDSYDGAPADGSAWTSEDEDDCHRVLRGGSWEWELPRAASRGPFNVYVHPNPRPDIGFRVARTLD